jgi:chemotaxis protein CheD
MHVTLRLKLLVPEVGTLPMEFKPKLNNVIDSEHSKQYLMPGRIFTASKPHVITAIVGSGVTVCLWDSISKVGGANHYLLPNDASGSPQDPKYAQFANQQLLREVLEKGANRNSLQAKIFGGSVPTVMFSKTNDCIGARNIEAAVQFVTQEKLQLVQREAGGTKARKILFQTDDGRSWMELL